MMHRSRIHISRDRIGKQRTIQQSMDEIPVREKVFKDRVGKRRQIMRNEGTKGGKKVKVK